MGSKKSPFLRKQLNPSPEKRGFGYAAILATDVWVCSTFSYWNRKEGTICILLNRIPHNRFYAPTIHVW